MRILYLCHFSNKIVRNHLILKRWKLRNFIFKLLHHPIQKHVDYAVWNTDFFAEFERFHNEEFHILSPHNGMKKAFQSFELNEINYHFFKDDGNLLSDWLKAKLRIGEKTNYISNRKKIARIIKVVEPDLIILCGAECTPFAISALDVKKVPIYVLLQTVANLQKYIDAGIGSDYERLIERMIFQKSQFFGTIERQFFEKYKEINDDALCLPVRFPTHNPCIYEERKLFEFVFFGRVVVNKGIEDVLRALAIVVKKHSSANLNIIGSCAPDYKEKLNTIIEDLELTDRVVFSPFFSDMDDMYRQVQKSTIAVLPGITASMNSTVREAMFMKIPTIVYETSACSIVNEKKPCLLIAKMKDVDDLAKKMCYCLDNPGIIRNIANNAHEYASTIFSNSQIGDRLIANCEAIYQYSKNNVPVPKELLFNESESV